MTNDPSQFDTTSLDTADPELERLLCDAYDAEPLPRSLLERIDLGVEQEWGVSPRLSDRPSSRLARSISGGARSVVRKSRWLRALPVAAALSIVIVLGVVFSANSRGYAWSDMLEAIARRGIVQIHDSDGVRWLSLADGLVGAQTATSAQLLDVRQNVLLVRHQGEGTIERRQATTNPAGVTRDQLLVGFLLGDVAAIEDPHKLGDLRLVEESWKRVSTAGNDEIALRAEFAAPRKSFALRVRLDPESLLPRSCEIVDGEVVARVETMTFPETDVQQLRERDFPPALRVVDVAASATERVAISTTAPDSAAPSSVDTDPVLSAVVKPVDTMPAPESAVQSFAAAASKWDPVSVPDLTHEQLLQQVNTALEDLWHQHGVEPTFAATDEELLRRVYLDLAGRTPSVHEVRAYLKDASADRYEVLVNRLLSSPDHASHLATVWRTFLIPEGVDLTSFGGVAAFDKWLADRFAAGEGYDEIVRALLLADGRLARSGPLLFYSAVKLDPDQLASRTSRVFLGMRLECAQCHDHPFEAWTQQDFWSYAAFFARISRPQGELATVSSVMRVRDIDRGEVTLPGTKTVMTPRFLDGTEFDEDQEAAPRRVQLARWLTGAENPYFARATANRVWGQLFGKGIIDPLDDFGEQHPPVSGELLDLLAGHFIHSGFSLQELFRTIVLSGAYRLSSGAVTVDDQRLELFAQMHVKTLTAEQVYDCISVATLLEPATSANPFAFNVVRFGNSDREEFLQQFRTPAGRMTEYLGGIPQALTLMNGTLIEDATGLSSNGLLASLQAPFFTNEQRIEVLYLATLSRHPRPSEWELLKGYIPVAASGSELQQGLADLLWALLNSAEFTMNH